jgi:ANTAR domain/GAF domain
VRLGALNLYRDCPGPLSGDQHANALVVGVAARWVLEAQAGAPFDVVAEELEIGANFHFVVHNAAGMVSVQEGISVTEALIRLRAFAFSNDRYRCVKLLGVSAAGVMLASPAGTLGLVASSSEAMRLLELFELQEQEGPCLDAFRTGERVGAREPGCRAGRWPSFSAAALQAGFQSASALPLRLGEVTLGALNLFSVTRAPMEEADVIVARAFADLATLSIVQHRASAEAQRLNEQLSGALTSRVVIEQAKGVISERADVDLAEAFSRLRAYARNSNLRLADVARAAIDGTLDPLAWAAV